MENGSSANPLRIGLYGGTFNPVHIGHLRCMVELKSAFSLDQVLMIPSASPPHKSREGMASALDRLAMLRLSIGDNPLFLVSDVEVNRKGPSYSIDTVKHYLSEGYGADELFFIMGVDAFLEIDTWKSHDELLELIPIIVMNRPGKRGLTDLSFMSAVEDYLQTQIASGYKVADDSAKFEHPRKQPVFLQNVTALDISSTRIRDLIKNQQSIRYLVPDSVADFIAKKGLYQ